MTDSPKPKDRDRRVRRTTSARRGVVAAGALGALGAAAAIGVGIQHTDAATTTQVDSQGNPQQSTPRRSQTSTGGQLAGPSGGGAAHGRSGGS